MNFYFQILKDDLVEQEYENYWICKPWKCEIISDNFQNRKANETEKNKQNDKYVLEIMKQWISEFIGKYKFQNTQNENMGTI
jgi:hypothetical protein